MVERLKDEERKQTDHIRLVMARLMREKDSWFPSGKSPFIVYPFAVFAGTHFVTGIMCFLSILVHVASSLVGRLLCLC